MEDITEKEIERYVCYPETLSGKQHRSIREKIESSEELQELAGFFEKFDQSLRYVKRDRASENAVTLTPFDPEPDISRPHRLVLAAQTTEQESKLQTVATLASEENETVVRILNERNTDHYRIHVLSKLLDSEDISILSIPDLSNELVIKEDGSLRFVPEVDLSDYDWESASFVLYLPAERFSVNVNDIRDGEKVREIKLSNHTVKIEGYKEKMEGEILPDQGADSNFSRIVIRGEATGPYISPVSPNTFSLPVDQRDDSVMFWLFE